MALLNIGLPVRSSLHCWKNNPISNLVGIAKMMKSETMKNNKPYRPLACEANYNTTNTNIFHLKINQDFTFPDEFFTHYERKLEEVRQSLMESVQDPVGSLNFVDAIQRLGMGRHYHQEIHAILKQHWDRIYSLGSLHDVSLSFRLLRRGGFNVSADVFNDFKGEDGRFKAELKNDTKGLMQLYEASQLRFEGENILDEAEEFSKKNLCQDLAANTDNMNHAKWSNIVSMGLRHHILKTLNISLSRDLTGGIDIGLLFELANMKLVVRKSTYQQELLQISEWWDDLGLVKGLELARNEPLKLYPWAMGILGDDISLSEQRVQLSKYNSFIYVIDDIFDHYGTPQELAIFTQAVERWDYASMDTLPDYMKPCYKALLDTTDEIGHSICEKYGYNPIDAFKQTWKELCNSFLVEARWFASADFPSAEDYLANGKVSSGGRVVLVHLFCLLGVSPTHLDDASTLMSCVSAILRLWNDIGSAKDEHQNGKDGSYVESFMRDHNNDITRDQAHEHVINMIATERKRLNKECFNLKHLPLQEACLNLVGMAPFMYDYQDNQRISLLKELLNIDHFLIEESIRV